MASLSFDRLIDDVGIGKFDCGNGSINKMICESAFPTALNQAHAYCVKHGKRILGYYMITFLTNVVSNGPEILGEYTNFLDSFTSLHVVYVAIDKRYQNNGLGTHVLEHIVQTAKELCEKIPIMFITLEALKEKQSWYAKRGFLPVNLSVLKDEEQAISNLMYFPCFDISKKVDNYHERQI